MDLSQNQFDQFVPTTCTSNQIVKSKITLLISQGAVIKKLGQTVNVGQYYVLPQNLISLNSTINSSTGFVNDHARFTDSISGTSLDSVFISEGNGELIVNGNTYKVSMAGNAGNATGERMVNVSSSSPIAGYC